MSDFDENKFDREIRSLLDGVEEEVPDRVWDALSDRLDHIGKARKRKTALTWLRYSGIAAAAAAVALGVFFGVGDPVRTVGPDSTLAAVEQTDQEKTGDVTAVRSGTDENEPVSTGDIRLQGRENVLERVSEHDEAGARQVRMLSYRLRFSKLREYIDSYPSQFTGYKIEFSDTKL